MRVEETIDRLRSNPGDRKELLRAARDFGREFLAPEVSRVEGFRTGLAALERFGGDEWERGFRAALIELALAFEHVTYAQADLAFVKDLARTRKHWKEILAALREPARPSDLSAKLGLDPSATGRILHEMRVAELVLVRAPRRDQKSKFHELTLLGAVVAH